MWRAVDLVRPKLASLGVEGVAGAADSVRPKVGVEGVAEAAACDNPWFRALGLGVWSVWFGGGQGYVGGVRSSGLRVQGLGFSGGGGDREALT